MCERNIDWLPLVCPQPGTWPTTQACALAGNWTSNPSVHRSAFNPLNHFSQGNFLDVLMFFTLPLYLPISLWYMSKCGSLSNSSASGLYSLLIVSYYLINFGKLLLVISSNISSDLFLLSHLGFKLQVYFFTISHASLMLIYLFSLFKNIYLLIMLLQLSHFAPSLHSILPTPSHPHSPPP